ncbi:MAG: hypothetical protein QF790_08480 [Gammaproteobacteria bacterium]|jgi:hypothetical protein|nr:hypothetical protein [Gammaproteobacteria bacterium]MDP6617182.1 hypothetical protein [Gammaproteobacteria bacterium]MDP6695391.1 hypothetical protein [Gammaproteobacteria bacterium]
MSDTKQNGYSGHSTAGYEEELSHAQEEAVVEAPAPARPQREAAKRNVGGREVTSWDAYRNWLTKVQAPEQRRSLPDPALFSWKGYRSWAEKIRRDWDADE